MSKDKRIRKNFSANTYLHLLQIYPKLKAEEMDPITGSIELADIDGDGLIDIQRWEHPDYKPPTDKQLLETKAAADALGEQQGGLNIHPDDFAKLPAG